MVYYNPYIIMLKGFITINNYKLLLQWLGVHITTYDYHDRRTITARISFQKPSWINQRAVKNQMFN